MSATAPGASVGAPAAPPGRRRWLNVALASALINTSYGTMSYSFAVLITGSGPGGEFGRGMMSLAFGLAALVSGLAGLAVGTVADLFGSRRLIALGAVWGAGGLALLGACREPWQVIVVMVAIIGPARAATFYEPVYVLMNRWFEPAARPRAYGTLTMLSGVSITIFTPLTQLLIEAFGWRETVVILGGILAFVGVAVAALIPEGSRAAQAGTVVTPGHFLREAWEGVRQTNARYWVFTLAFFVATTALSGYSFHMISQLETRGFDETAVANAIAVTGLVSLPMRFTLPTLSQRTSSTTLLSLCLGMLGVAALIASRAGEWWQVWLYVAVFGLVFGAVYPLRALAMSERFGGPYFGRVIGLQALFVAVAGAAGPIVVSAFGTDETGYQHAFTFAAVTLFGAATLSWLAMRGRGAPQAVAEVASGAR